MNAEKAFKDLIIKFPFNGYIKTNSLNGIYKTVANVAIKNLRPGASILDFGSGPCDKTGLLKLMGFNCTACDDLQDEWHTEETNREKILNFAISLDMIMLVCLIFGAFISAYMSGDFKIRTIKSKRIPNAVLGGLVMGFG